MADDKKKIHQEEAEAMAMATKNLPEDLIVDIFSRLPVKSLLKFRCVCKSWCALITDPIFVKMHLNRSLATNTNLSLVFKSSSSLYSVDLDACEQDEDSTFKLVENARALGSCNGLLCVSNNYVNDIVLLNPSTRMHKRVPITPIEVDTIPRFIVYGFGYNPTTDDYKLVRIVQSVDRSWDSEVKLYSFSTNSWRRIRDIPFQLIPHQRGILANSALHWVGKRGMGPRIDSCFIISFELKDEEFRELPLLEFMKVNILTSIENLRGQLCLLNFIFDVELWVMKDYGVRDSWVKQFSFKQQPLMSRSYFRLISYSKNSEIILEKDYNELVMYDPSSGRARNLRISGVHSLRHTVTCVGSLLWI